MKENQNLLLFKRASAKIPGGVNSPVRAWKAVGSKPLFITHALGPCIYDACGKKYTDFVGSWGPAILGHAHPKIIRTLQKTAAGGLTFGAPTEHEVRLAELVCEVLPSIEKLRLVSSGTEATMSALRLSRAYTGRSKILKFDGCYHGHSDGLLVKAGSGVATLALPDSPGVPTGFSRETLVAQFNHLNSVEELFRRHGKNIAAVIVEPVCGNIGVIPPAPGFLAGLRRLTNRFGALLIFDEVITGFRLALGGAQSLVNIKPDLTCLGKILGGGLPLAAFGGRREIMDLLAPEGPVYQAGTLSGNPLAVTAGIATLRLLQRRGTYERLESNGKYLENGFKTALAENGIKAAINRVGSMMTIFFGLNQVTDADQARQCNRAQFARFFHGMLARGIYLPPAPFEAMFISLAHRRADLSRTASALNHWAKQEAVG
ncbi:MAG: glutamate-1-semialdehyde 2,1-aminomutase [Deltaproteobacteria bacterium]|nr:glutamate-1-semialdehyde 2,1-aminomutase [Deltaproteobacteria bacterium]